MWLDAIWASPDVVILREAVGEALIVFCVTFVCMVGVFKLAERSVDLELPVRGKRETGEVRHKRERGPVAPQHLAASWGEHHDERSSAARTRPESHMRTKLLQNTTSAPPMKLKSKGSMSVSRHSASCGAIDEMRRSSARDAQQYLAAKGARRREPHDCHNDERSPAARGRPESHRAFNKSKGVLSGMQHSASCSAIDEMKHSSSSGSMRPAGDPILRRSTSSSDLDSIAEASQYAQQYLAATGARRREPHDERSPAARARPESHSASIKSKGALSGMRHSASCGAIDEMRHGSSRGSVGGMRHSSSSGSMCHAGSPILRRNTSASSLDSIAEASPDAQQYLAATGARRREPHDERSPAARARPERREPHDERSPAARARHERSPAARARPESHGKSREGSTTSGMRRSSSFDAIDEMMHNPERGSLSGLRHSSVLRRRQVPEAQPIVRCGLGLLREPQRSLDSIVEVSSDGASEQSGSLVST